jgi:hypothetical protein
MNHVEKPPIDLPARDRPDDLDDLLRAFFRAEMPQPWPAVPRPRAQTAPLLAPAQRSRWALARSRFALAASVGILVACLWALAGKFTANSDAVPGNAKPTMPTSDIRIKESLIQDQEDGTKMLIEVFDK